MATKWFLMVCDLLESKIKQKSKKFGFDRSQFLTIPQPTVDVCYGCCRYFFCVLPSCIISNGLVNHLNLSYLPGAHLPKQSFCMRKLNQNL